MNLTPTTIFLYAIFLYSSFGFSQNTRKDSISMYFKQIDEIISNQENNKEEFLDVESLIAKKNTTDGIDKVNILFKLYFAHVFNSIEQANDFNNQALQLSSDIGYKKGEFSAKYNRAYILFVGGYFNESMVLVEAVEKIVDFESYPEVSANVKTLKSYIYTEKGEYDLALELGLKLLDEGEILKNDYVLMRGWGALSHYYLRNENYSKALSYCLKAMHYVIKLRKMIHLYSKIDEIARMSAKLNDTETAFEAYDFYLEMEKKLSPPGSYIQSIVYMNIADIYMADNAFETAQGYLSRSLDLIYENNYGFRIPRALKLQAELYLKTQDTLNAILHYEKSLNAARDINAFDVIKSNSSVLSSLYLKCNDPLKAHKYDSLNKSISDSLFTKEKEQKIVILEAQRNIKEVTQEKRILSLENKAQNARINFIILILIFLLITSGLSAYSYFKVKSKNKVLYNRTIEMAEVQLEMNEKLIDFQNAKRRKALTNHTDEQIKPSQNIDEDVKNIILSKLENLERDDFFLDPNCNLRRLAQQLKTNPKYLSQVINQEKESNFNNYINELRINYLLPKLLKDIEFRNSKLSYIAVSIGYNNLNTFNAAFKKRQGILPSYFVKQLNNESKIRTSA